MPTAPPTGIASEHDGQLAITFHGIGPVPSWVDSDEEPYWIGVDHFRRCLDVAVDRQVSVTFDDGNETDATVALPELVDLGGLRGRFFVLAGRVGREGTVAEDALRELVGRGMTVGSHGVGHLDWRTLDDTALADELERSRDVLHEATGASIREAACPFGAYDRRVLGALRRHGYDRVHTSDGAGRRVGRLQPRLTVTSTMAIDELTRRLDEAGRPGRRLQTTARLVTKSLR